MLFHAHEVALNQLAQENICQWPAYLPLNRLQIVSSRRLCVMLWEFISAPCISNVQGFTKEILIFQAPLPLRPPQSTESPAGGVESSRAPRQGAVPSGVLSGARTPTAATGGLTLGITGVKGAKLQSWEEKCWKRSLCGGCHCQG